MVPLLPCTSIDEMASFWVPLGTKVSYRQMKPNPYLALEREGGFVLHYFALAGFVSEESYSTCVVLVDDPGELFDEWAAGLRTRYGKLPLTGLPRITRPRRRKNADYRTGFSLVDPAGNWIRVIAARPTSAEPLENDPLSRALDNAVVLADSHGDVAQAHKILAGALARHGAEGLEPQRAAAEEFLAELNARLANPSGLKDQNGSS
jgi:hypothetical protein